MSTTRPSGRAPEALRSIEIIPNFTKWAEGAALCCFGDTRVLCTASVDDRLPPWLRDKGQGWVTAEYEMLPRSTDRRMQREAVQGKRGGRTHEISRLIGRALRAGVDMKALGERTVTLDCDVLQADGGTRTAAITGAWVALALAMGRQVRAGKLKRNPVQRQVAAVSVGVVGGEVVVDLDYAEDKDAETDLNLVMDNAGGVLEVQGTAERGSFSRAELDQMLDVGGQGIEALFALQREVVDLELGTDR